MSYIVKLSSNNSTLMGKKEYLCIRDPYGDGGGIIRSRRQFATRFDSKEEIQNIDIQRYIADKGFSYTIEEIDDELE